MVVLHKVFEAFSGNDGTYWLSGKNGSATQFTKWLNEAIRIKTGERLPVSDTHKEYVERDGDGETLVISYGRQDERPIDVKVTVSPSNNPKITVDHRINYNTRNREVKTYEIKNPFTLSIDPQKGKLVSVVFDKKSMPNFAPEYYLIKDIQDADIELDNLRNTISRLWNIKNVPLLNTSSIFDVTKVIDDIRDIQIPYDSRTIKDSPVNVLLEQVEKASFPDGTPIGKDAECKKIIKVIRSTLIPKISKDLTEIPEFISAFEPLKEPLNFISSFIKEYNKDSYKSRNQDDFDNSQLIRDIKNKYSKWAVDTDTTHLASSNTMIYMFYHPNNPDYNFKLYVKDLGGGNYSIKGDMGKLTRIEFSGIESRLADELEKLNRPSGVKEMYIRAYEIAKAKDITGQTKLDVFYEDPKQKVKGGLSKLDEFVQLLIKSIDDPSISRLANLTITYNNDLEVWDLYLITQRSSSKRKDTSEEPVGHIIWTVNKDGVVQNLVTDFGYTSSVHGCKITSPILLDDIKRAADKFRDEYAAFGTASKYSDQREVTTRQVTLQNNKQMNIPMTDWVSKYINPEYNMKYWEDIISGKIEPALNKLQEEYNITLEPKSEEEDIEVEEPSSYNSFLDKYGLNNTAEKEMPEIEHKGRLLYAGEYLDKFFSKHTIELRINFERGFRFLVWIRPDNMGSSNLKASGQNDLNFFISWVRNNVSMVNSQKTAEVYQKAILSELVNKGGSMGKIPNTVDFVTSKMKDLNINVRVQRDKVIADIYKNGKIIKSLEIMTKPFEKPAISVASSIISSTVKLTKESFPAVDRRISECNRYWGSVLDKIAKESNQKITHDNEFGIETISIYGRKCRFRCESTGNIVLCNMFGKEVISEALCADNRYFVEDVQSLKQLLNENKYKF